MQCGPTTTLGWILQELEKVYYKIVRGAEIVNKVIVGHKGLRIR